MATGLIVVLLVNLFSLDVMFHRTPKAASWREAARYVSSRIEHGQALVFIHGRWRWVFGYYYRGPEVSVETLFTPSDYSRVSSFVKEFPVIYLVLKEAERVDGHGIIRAQISSRLALSERRAFSGGIVIERYGLEQGR